MDNQSERILESVDEHPVSFSMFNQCELTQFFKMIQEEFDAWLANARLKNQCLPTIQWVRKRQNEIRDALTDAIRHSAVNFA